MNPPWKLINNHPVTKDGTLCPICHKLFKEEELVNLVPVRQPAPGMIETVPAILVHEECRLL